MEVCTGGEDKMGGRRVVGFRRWRTIIERSHRRLLLRVEEEKMEDEEGQVH